MVIDPESLIFLSVPSCAAAPAQKPSAASKASAVFIVSSLGLEKFYLVQRCRGIAQPLRHGREQRDAEGGLRFHEIQEHVAVEGEKRAIGLRDRVRGARRLVDER